MFSVTSESHPTNRPQPYQMCKAKRFGVKSYQLLSTLFLLSALTSACGKSEPSAGASGPPPTVVKLETLQTNTLQDSTEFVGTLEAEQTVNLKPQADGRIEQILVKPGTLVKKGQQIFVLSPDQTVPQYNSAQATVNANIAARGTAVQQLQVAQSQLKSAQAQYDLAEITDKRNQFLAKQGAYSQAQADQAASDLKVKRDAVKTAQEQVKSAQASINQSEANIRQAQAQAAAAEVNVNYKRVLAPISGAVGNITLKVGDYVTTGQTLTTINQNNFFDLQIPIPLNHSGELRQGLAVQLLDPTTKKQLGSGNIYFVSSQADPNAQSILTRARFPNVGNSLRDSQYVEARVIWNTKPGVLVPTEAVTPIGGQNFVFVAQERTVKGKSQMVAHQVPVKLGSIQGQDYQIESGLKPGDKVVVSGVIRLREGSPITPQASNTPSSPQS